MTLHLRVLGGLSLTGDSRRNDSPYQRRSLALLAVLAVHEDRGISREKLAALLWPESDEGNARNSLKQVIYLLRRDLGQEAVLGSGTLRLGSGTVTCDLVTFQ